MEDEEGALEAIKRAFAEHLYAITLSGMMLLVSLLMEASR
jgi:hypothetical protein